MRGQNAVTAALIIVGVILLSHSINVGTHIGSIWFGEQATFPWRMNNYIIIEAQYAYAIFGLAVMALGGLASGLTAPAMVLVSKCKKHKLALACTFFIAILFTGLGFNTLDFMLGIFFWTDMKYPPPVQVAILGEVDVWNYYFFLFVFPLWLGGFLIGIATSLCTFFNINQQLERSFVTMKSWLKNPTNPLFQNRTFKSAHKKNQASPYICEVETRFSRSQE